MHSSSVVRWMAALSMARVGVFDNTAYTSCSNVRAVFLIFAIRRASKRDEAGPPYRIYTTFQCLAKSITAGRGAAVFHLLTRRFDIQYSYTASLGRGLYCNLTPKLDEHSQIINDSWIPDLQDVYTSRNRRLLIDICTLAGPSWVYHLITTELMAQHKLSMFQDQSNRHGASS